jgi:hypothetical protein
MKHLILFLGTLYICMHCAPIQQKNNKTIRDGFYEVVKLGTTAMSSDSLDPAQVIVDFDTLFNPGDYTRVAIDTLDYVPLELEKLPTTEQQTELKKLLSISLTPAAAEKMKTFTAQRVMKEVAVVIDGKAVTMHKVREAITGSDMQITRCDDNACDYLYVKLKNKVK